MGPSSAAGGGGGGGGANKQVTGNPFPTVAQISRTLHRRHLEQCVIWSSEMLLDVHMR